MPRPQGRRELRQTGNGGPSVARSSQVLGPVRQDLMGYGKDEGWVQ